MVRWFPFCLKITNLDNSVGNKPSGETDTLWDKIGILSNYSTTEQIIGKWIDGKPLYRKVVPISALPNSTTKTYAHNISNLGTIIEAICIVTDGWTIMPIPCTDTVQFRNQIKMFLNLNNISIVTAQDFSSYTGQVILKYTKTTD